MTREWTTLHTYEDIKYEFFNGIAKVTINRPEVRNAFRPIFIGGLSVSDARYWIEEPKRINNLQHYAN